MKSKPRMNLFRELLAPTLKIERAPIQFGLYAKVVAGVAAVMVILLIRGEISQRSAIRETRAKAKEAGEKLAQLSKQAGELADAMKVKKMEKAKAALQSAQKPLDVAPAAGVKSGRATASTAEPLDGTWTALLWRFSSLTTTGILINQMSLSGQSAVASRGMTLSGSASSLAELRDWIDRLITEIPGWDFVMESGTVTTDGKYPVGFRVTARAL